MLRLERTAIADSSADTDTLQCAFCLAAWVQQQAPLSPITLLSELRSQAEQVALSKLGL